MRLRGPALAAVPGWPLLGAGLLSVALLALLGRDPGRLVEAVRWATVALALGATGVFDEASAELRASLPTPDRRVRLHAVAIVAPALAAGWALLTWLADRPAVTGDQVAAALDSCVALARQGLAWEAAAVLAVALAAAAAAARRGAGVGSAVAGGTAAVMLYAAKGFVPERLTLVAGPGDPRWVPAQARWGLLLLLAAGAVVVLSGDRWRRPRPWRAAASLLGVAAVAAGVLTLTARPQDLAGTFAAAVANQGLAAADVSVGGAEPAELRHGGAPGGLETLQVMLVVDGATVQAHLPVTGSTTAAELRAWSAALPEIRDGERFTAAVAAALPPGLRLRDPEAPATGPARAEVIVDRRADTPIRAGVSIASVATAGERSCGVSLAPGLHGALEG